MAATTQIPWELNLVETFSMVAAFFSQVCHLVAAKTEPGLCFSLNYWTKEGPLLRLMGHWIQLINYVFKTWVYFKSGKLF